MKLKYILVIQKCKKNIYYFQKCCFEMTSNYTKRIFLKKLEVFKITNEDT